MKEAKCGEREVYFVDASHFIYTAFLGYVWCLTRLFVRSPSSRKRFNVLGALNAVSHQLITVMNTTTIHSGSVCELIRKLRRRHKRKPITLIVDNARYFHSKVTKIIAYLYQVDLLFLPPYSPNLNLIERLWKFIKNKCLYSQYYNSFEDFQTGITECLSKTSGEYKEELKTLLSLRFQSLEKLNLL